MKPPAGNHQVLPWPLHCLIASMVPSDGSAVGVAVGDGSTGSGLGSTLADVDEAAALGLTAGATVSEPATVGTEGDGAAVEGVAALGELWACLPGAGLVTLVGDGTGCWAGRRVAVRVDVAVGVAGVLEAGDDCGVPTAGAGVGWVAPTRVPTP